MMNDGRDLAEMARIVEELYLAKAVKKHGAEGSNRVRRILEFVTRLFQARDPENLAASVTVFSCLSGVTTQLPNTEPEKHSSLASVVLGLEPPVLIQILDDGSVLTWHGVDSDPIAMSSWAIVYRYDNRSDLFFVDGARITVRKLYAAAASQFAHPRYRSLAEALERYKVQVARRSRCAVLKSAWFDEERLFYRIKPEDSLRDSLEQFLVAVLSGEAEIRPEHNVDESHPVDLRVYWNLGNQESLIEIKWLGASRSATKLGTRYSATRARQGARQLADYLEQNKERSGERETRGSLVVFDGRRKLPSKEKPTKAQAFYYEHAEIEYSPDYATTRHDFDPPIRLFIEPKL